MTPFGLLALAALALAVWALVRLRGQEALLGELRRQIEDLRAGPPAAPPPAPAPVPSPQPAPAEEFAEDETVALLTLAAAAWLRAPARILAINYPVPSNLGWAAEGREDIMHSHRVR